MFNVAVINIKDIIKYAIKLAICIGILFLAVFFLSNSSMFSNISIDYSFLNCLDICIPGLRNIEFEKNSEIKLASLLEVEMPISKYFVETETIEQETKNTKSEEKVEYNLPDSKDIQTEVIPTNVPESYTDTFEGVNIKNGSDFELTDDMLSKDVTFKNSKKILIFHTHTCESYTPSETYQYEMTGNFRTTDLNYTVARVGTELANYLETAGFTVIHDLSCYDYPSYDESYDRAYDSISSQLEKNPDFEILFDIHRDAIADSSYAPTVKIGEEYAAQLMFVIGSNGAGQDHSNWLLNLNFAAQVQRKANEKYPGLFKPILFRNSRYNQNLGKGACIIEVGATGNTLEQCNTSMKYLADVLKDIL